MNWSLLVLLYLGGWIQADPALQDSVTKVLETLRGRQIDAPNLDGTPSNIWIPLDDSIEVRFTNYKQLKTRPKRLLDVLCRKLSADAEALRFPSYPNIVGYLKEIKQPQFPNPWILNVYREKPALRLLNNDCVQIHIPVKTNNTDQTQEGTCSKGKVMCTRRRKWRREEIAKVAHSLTLEVAERTLNVMNVWSGAASVQGPIQGPNILPLLKGIEIEAWNDQETSYWLSYATSVIADWSMTSAINSLTAKDAVLDSKLNKLLSLQTTTPPPSGREDQTESDLPNPSLNNWEARISLLEAKWAQFLLINNDTYQRVRRLLEASELMDENLDGSGLSREMEDAIEEPRGLGVWRSLCNSLAQSIDLTLIRRRRNSNESLQVTEDQDIAKNRKGGVIAKVAQIYDKISEQFYTPMEKCVPCWVMVLSITGLSGFMLIHSITICVLCLRIKRLNKRSREIIELDENIGETYSSRTKGKGHKVSSINLGKPRTTKKVSYKVLPAAEH